MLSSDVEYTHVSAITKYKSDLIHGAFDQFIKIFTAIVGGSIWLSRQNDLTAVARENFRTLSNATVTLLVLYTAFSVLDDFRSWYGYRERLTIIGEHAEVQPKIKPANIWTAAIKPIGMVVAVLTALHFFWRFNPF